MKKVVMSRRPILPALLLAAALVACGGQRAVRASAPGGPGGEDRFERAACARGEYPATLDAAAMAWARQEDLRASRASLSAPFETERIVAARAAFDRRCERWLTEGSASHQRSAARVAP